MAKPVKPFTIESLERLSRVLKSHGVEYLIIGKFGAIVYGFPDTTQDIDIYPEKSKPNSRRLFDALQELGFETDQTLQEAVLAGKDFIQLRGEPFDMDIVFAPDGFESFAEVKKSSNLIEGKFPVASIEDIIKSKRSASRQKDKEILNRLEAFAKHLREQGHQ